MTVPSSTPPTPITLEHLRGLPGLRRGARDALLAAQPRTVHEALRLPDIGRSTTRHLLALGLITDDDRLQDRTLAQAARDARSRS